MEYRNLGRAGLKVSSLSFGSWLTFGGAIDLSAAGMLIKAAFDRGVNFFDNAEVYGEGESERLMGRVLKEFRRESLVVSTKIFWGGPGPNDTGLSWKHLVEGTRNSLKRLQLEYIDILFCHRPDPKTPIEETVRAMDFIIRSGLAFYWGTSEWPATAIETAFTIAERYGCIPPAAEQPQYNLLERQRFEVEYAGLFKDRGLGSTVWSPLASGILSGKYSSGIPKGTRLAEHQWLKDKLTPGKMEIVKRLAEVSRQVGCPLSQLAIAWCLKNPNVSTVILGATNLQQLEENMNALEVSEKLTPEAMANIEQALRG